MIYDRILKGETGIGISTGFNTTEFKSHQCGEVKDFQVRKYLTCSKVNVTQKVTQYAVAAAKNALLDAGLDLTGDSLAGLVVGTAFSGTTFKERLKKSLCADIVLSPRIAANAVSSEPSGKICMELGIIGHTSIVSSGSTSGFNAIQYASLLLKTTRAHRVLVVATEELSQLAFSAFDDLNLLATVGPHYDESSRPFSRHRTGFIFSEGAGALLLESAPIAKQRGAKILGYIRGGSILNNNHNSIAVTLSAAMDNAMKEAHLSSTDIGYIAASANGSVICDKQEVMAIKRSFGKYYDRVSVSSIKDKIGETLGAAGILSMIAAILAMQRHELPDNPYLFDEEREFDLNFVLPNNRRHKNIEHFMINSFDSFGNFGALILGNP